MRSQKWKRKFTNRSRGEVAHELACELISLEREGNGDQDGALRRLATMTGIGYSTWRNWWYGYSQDVLNTTWELLLNAMTLYQREVLRQAELLAQQLEEARRLGTGNEVDAAVLGAISALGGSEDLGSETRPMQHMSAARGLRSEGC